MRHPIDLRSDTVTQPTAAMRRAMADAVVGDDVYAEDPTTRKLEERAAALLNRAAALYVPSGTMGNQIAIHVHTRPGREVIAEAGAHVFNFEMGAMAALSGVLPRPVVAADGILTPEQVGRAVQPKVGYATPTGLLVLENSHNLAGGRITPLARMAELVELAHRHGLPVHLDGARIHNSAAALGCSAEAVAAGCDTVMFCLSKGLAAPVGSLLVGDQDTITEARRVRKMFGGGMRQCGVIAAAGLVALDEMLPRLGDDNRRAHELAEGIAGLPGLELDPAAVETNIVFFGLAPAARVSAAELAARLAAHGVLVHALGHDRVRMVTHYHIDDQAIGETVRLVDEILRGRDR